MSKNLIVGAGLSGAVMANLLATKNNEKVVVIDRRNNIAGNIYDYKEPQTGITVHKFGPHIFHTNNEQVWEYLSKYTKWYDFVFMPNVYINGEYVTLPFNLTTIEEVFPPEIANRIKDKLISAYGFEKKIPILELMKADDEDLKFVANFVYENVFKNYTIKQWGLKPEEIDPTVTARVPIFISYDNRYFQDKHQGIPAEGYTKMIENLLNHPNIEVRLNTEYKNVTEEFDKIFYSGAIDEFFDYKFGELPYRSLHFNIKILDKEYSHKTAMTNYPNNYDFTRITEHKYFLNEKSPKTVISEEYPQKFELGKNERYYPISNPQTAELYQKYAELAKQIPNLYFIGRLGEYKYYNMDLAVENIFKKFEEFQIQGGINE